MVWTFMHNFDNSKGIIYQRMFVECSQQNGIVERKYQNILNVANETWITIPLTRGPLLTSHMVDLPMDV